MPLHLLAIVVLAGLAMTGILVFVLSGLYFYYAKFDAANACMRHPMMEGRHRDEMLVHDLVNVCTCYYIRLSFYRWHFWPFSYSHRVLGHVNPREVPRNISVPLLLTYWSLNFSALCFVLLGMFDMSGYK